MLMIPHSPFPPSVFTDTGKLNLQGTGAQRHAKIFKLLTPVASAFVARLIDIKNVATFFIRSITDLIIDHFFLITDLWTLWVFFC
jgi:hypothetical protein